MRIMKAIFFSRTLHALGTAVGGVEVAGALGCEYSRLANLDAATYAFTCTSPLTPVRAGTALLLFFFSFFFFCCTPSISISLSPALYSKKLANHIHQALTVHVATSYTRAVLLRPVPSRSTVPYFHSARGGFPLPDSRDIFQQSCSRHHSPRSLFTC
ncbi:hypothetical protein BDP55DRAFT_244481 [Colletotrichum godetiae]|uniref:Uncharacterized protein n=1 Tax=Colletotrichum godetiae TaxID=1209918 RepID=A0AAJ0AHV6_9PEZI|nr:uncharacterized protein BDP55DRAFT_244481 [Colletotrichum godetiae]KAK1672733.1 hypothetical protein BDP55DRAFT_244481 [Colletotrichum godetiae]